ncbi:MAG: formylglycine-generating enzyme family protein, partial [bacterium]
VENMTWFDAVLFCNKRAKIQALDTCYTYTGTAFNGNRCTVLNNIQCNFKTKSYRLPTESEWEYSFRAGTTTRYHWGDNASELGNYAWYLNNAGGTTHAVATKLPNQWGIYDMVGNVIEACWDWSAPYSADHLINPTGPPSTGTYRIIRGDAFGNTGCAAYARWDTHPPTQYQKEVGFRCVFPAQ